MVTKCPECGAEDSLFEIDSIPRRREILGFTEDGSDFIYGPPKYLDGGECYYECSECGNEVDFDQVFDATYPDEEG